MCLVGRVAHLNVKALFVFSLIIKALTEDLTITDVFLAHVFHGVRGNSKQNLLDAMLLIGAWSKKSMSSLLTRTQDHYHHIQRYFHAAKTTLQLNRVIRLRELSEFISVVIVVMEGESMQNTKNFDGK